MRILTMTIGVFLVAGWIALESRAAADQPEPTATSAASEPDVIVPWPDGLADYDMKAACYVTTVYADESTIEQCFANLNHPPEDFENVCSVFGLTSAPDDELHARSRNVPRCPSGFDGACVESHFVGQEPPHITFYYNMNTGPQNQLEMVRSQCTREARTMPMVRGKWFE